MPEFVSQTRGSHLGDYALIESRKRPGMGCSHYMLYEIKDIIIYRNRICDTLSLVEKDVAAFSVFLVFVDSLTTGRNLTEFPNLRQR
jgi:hypothetical protein